VRPRASRAVRLAPRDGMRSKACVDATRAINVCLARCVEVWRRAPRRSNENTYPALDRHTVIFFIINRGFTHYTMYIDSWTPAMTRGMRVQRRRRRRRRRDRHRRRRGAQRLCWHRLAPRDAPTRDARARSDAYVSKSRQRSHVATARRLTYRRAATTDSLASTRTRRKRSNPFVHVLFFRGIPPRARGRGRRRARRRARDIWTGQGQDGDVGRRRRATHASCIVRDGV